MAKKTKVTHSIRKPVTDDEATLSYILAPLRPLAIAVDELELDERNARKHPDINLTAIKASLTKFGQRKPIVVQKNPETGRHVIRAGNGTYMGTKALGRKFIAAVIHEEPDTEAMAYAIADNRTTDLSEFDDAVLLENLDEVLASDEVDLETMGFLQEDYDKLAEKMRGAVDDDTSDIPQDNVEFLLVVNCADEAEQAQLYEEFKSRGIQCKIMS